MPVEARALTVPPSVQVEGRFAMGKVMNLL
jgi:hypothetical protein